MCRVYKKGRVLLTIFILISLASSLVLWGALSASPYAGYATPEGGEGEDQGGGGDGNGGGETDGGTDFQRDYHRYR